MANLAPNHILRGSIPEVLLNIKFKFVMFITGMNIGEGTKKRDLLTCKTGMQRKATCKSFFHCLHWYYAGCSTYIHATYQLDNLLVGDSLYQTSRLSTGIMLGAVHTYVLRTNWTICCWVTASTRPADSVLGWTMSPHTYLHTHMRRENVCDIFMQCDYTGILIFCGQLIKFGIHIILMVQNF